MNYLVLFMVFLVTSTMVNAIEGDIDDDSVIDEADACADTPQDTIIVDPIANLDFAGCSCTQIRAMVDQNNPCVRFECAGSFLSYETINYGGPLVDCPDRDNYSECIGTTYYQYPQDGYPRCVNGQLQNYSCDALVEENTWRCGFLPSEEELIVNGTKEVPVLSGVIRTFSDDYESQLSISHPEALEVGDTAEIVFLIEFSQANFQTVKLRMNNVDYQPKIAEYCHDTPEGSSRWCEFTWDVDIQGPGEFEYTVEYAYTYVGELISGSLSNTLIVESVLISENPLISHTETSYLRTLCTDFIPNCNYQQFEEELLRAESSLRIEKIRTSDDGRTRYTITLAPRDKNVQDVTIIENIPKEIAQHIDEIEFSIEPTLVLKEDPLIMWHFDEIDGQQELSYDVDREIEVTGNTVVTVGTIVEKSNILNILIPIIVAILVIVGLVLMPKMRKVNQ